MTKKNSMAAVFESVDEVGSPLGPPSTAQEKIAVNKVLSEIVLSDAVQELAASLGIKATPRGNDAYDPDVFVRVVTRERDRLMEIHARLTQQNQAQGAREAALDAREASVAFRERRMDAFERLVPQPAPKRWYYPWR